MKKLQPPTFSAHELLNECILEISDPILRARLQNQIDLFGPQYTNYSNCSVGQIWCTLPKATHGNSKQIVLGDLTKAELMSLYDRGMVASNGAARKRYDEIKLLAHDECPYCGGCGEFVEKNGIGTLDHFLPKARFPIYSVLPSNLVPSCAVCNQGMGSNFPTEPSLQPLHPYFDATHFFDEKWTTTTVVEDEPVTVNFYADPPNHWCEKDKRRVLKHFENCQLAGRYRQKVASDLSSLVEQRKTVHKHLSPEQFSEILLVIANIQHLPINGWKRTLYYGLANSDWFCTHRFR